VQAGAAKRILHPFYNKTTLVRHKIEWHRKSLVSDSLERAHEAEAINSRALKHEELSADGEGPLR